MLCIKFRQTKFSKLGLKLVSDGHFGILCNPYIYVENVVCCYINLMSYNGQLYKLWSLLLAHFDPIAHLWTVEEYP